jgi:hypothetical protein
MANFDELTKDLPSAVKKVLAEEGFDSIAALKCASEKDIASLNLKVGHAALLRKMCVELQTASQDGPMMQKDSETIMDGLATLLGAMRKPSESQDSAATSGQSQCLRILDHINSSMLVEEEVSIGGGVTLKVNAKPKLDKISPAMWISANAKILAKLIARGDTAFEVEDYLTYNDMIGELAARFTWTSVVAFDDEYRQRQAATQFKWGTDAPHLCTVLLREKTATNNQLSKKQAANSGRRPVGASGKEVCLQFNKTSCHFGPRCQYEHSCITCGSKDHGSKDHPATNPTPGSGSQA